MAGSRWGGEWSGVAWCGAPCFLFPFFFLSFRFMGEAKNSKESFSETVKKYLEKCRFISFPLYPLLLIKKKGISVCVVALKF